MPHFPCQQGLPWSTALIFLLTVVTSALLCPRSWIQTCWRMGKSYPSHLQGCNHVSVSAEGWSTPAMRRNWAERLLAAQQGHQREDVAVAQVPVGVQQRVRCPVTRGYIWNHLNTILQGWFIMPWYITHREGGKREVLNTWTRLLFPEKPFLNIDSWCYFFPLHVDMQMFYIFVIISQM